MGLFVNPGMGSLLEDMNDDIYVDKSLIIAEFNKCYGSRRRFVCVSRPRRFGKTMVGNLVAAYYTCGADVRVVFARLKIARVREWDSLRHGRRCRGQPRPFGRHSGRRRAGRGKGARPGPSGGHESADLQQRGESAECHRDGIFLCAGGLQHCPRDARRQGGMPTWRSCRCARGAGPLSSS